MKVCAKCGAAKPVEEFYRETNGRDGRSSRCRECCRARSKAWYDANSDRARAKARAWREANPDRARAKDKAWREANPDRERERHWRRFGILSPTLEPFTVAHFDAMLAAQGGRCAICFRSEPNGKGWHVDHVKVSGKWGPARGILCSSCNTSLGHLGDDWDTILSAADYVRSAAPLIDAAASIGVADGQ